MKPIHFAVQNGHVEVIKFLVDCCGIDPKMVRYKNMYIMPQYCNSVFNLFIQQEISPSLLSQITSQFDVIELLTEQYGCTINTSFQSNQVCLFYINKKIIIFCTFTEGKLCRIQARD